MKNYTKQEILKIILSVAKAFTVIQNMLAYNLEQVADAKVFNF